MPVPSLITAEGSADNRQLLDLSERLGIEPAVVARLKAMLLGALDVGAAGAEVWHANGAVDAKGFDTAVCGVEVTGSGQLAWNRPTTCPECLRLQDDVGSTDAVSPPLP